MIPFETKLRKILKQRKIYIFQFSQDTGIDRANLFYRKNANQAHRKYIYMAIAYYLGMTVEELVDGTDGEIDWYGDCGI